MPLSPMDKYQLPAVASEKVLLQHHFLPSVARKVTEIIKHCQRGQDKTVKRFLKQLSSDAKLHRTSLAVEAVRSRRDDALRLLLENGAPVDISDLDGNTPLHLALLTDQKGMASILLHYGASTNLANISGRTPLHIACQLKLTDMVKKLLAHGVDVNALDKDNRSPLMMAAMAGCTSLVTILLKNGANPKIKDVHGWDALSYARICNNADMAQALSGHYSNKTSNQFQSSPFLTSGDGGVVSSRDCFLTFHQSLTHEPSLRSSPAAGDRSSVVLGSQMSGTKSKLQSPISRKSCFKSVIYEFTETSSTNVMSFGAAKALITNVLGKVENELQWRKALVNSLVQAEEEMDLTEQRISREVSEKENSERTADEADSKLDKLHQKLSDIKDENEKLHRLQQAAVQAETARHLKASESQQLLLEYHQLIESMVRHNKEVKCIAESVTSYLAMEPYKCSESSELFPKLKNDQGNSKLQCLSRLDEFLATLWSSLWAMATDIKCTHQLLTNQKARNGLLKETLWEMTVLSEDVASEYQHVLKVFYEGKSHQDMLNKMACELQSNIQDCFHVSDTLAN